jgi:hypothetical protein
MAPQISWPQFGQSLTPTKFDRAPLLSSCRPDMARSLTLLRAAAVTSICNTQMNYERLSVDNDPIEEAIVG